MARFARPGVGDPSYKAVFRWTCARLASVALLTLTGPYLCAEPTPSTPNRFVRDGVAVELTLAPTNVNTPPAAPLAGEPARIRFTITDTTTGKPVSRLHPAAWLSRHDAGNAAQPHSCAEKVREFLGGSIFAKPELDLNTFQVVTLNNDATLTVVDPLFGFGGTKLLALIPLPGVGSDWALTSDRKKLFVALPTAGKVAAIDTATWKVSALLDAGAAPERIAVQPDGRYVWVASTEKNPSSSDDVLTAIATDRGEVATQISLPHGAHEILFSADSHWAFVSSAESRALSVIDLLALKKNKEVNLGGVPKAAAYSRASEEVYLTDPTSEYILVFDAVKHAIVDRLSVEAGVSELKFGPDDRFGFIANPIHNRVEILDTATNRIIQRVQIEAGPEQVGFSSDMAYVLCRGSASVAIIPLKEIGREGQPVPVAQFVGGEASFGARRNHADALVAAPGESAVVVANATDKAVYYYMQGMAAPMGNFSNYGREPRAVLVVDRSLREVAPGIYETAVDLPAAGNYDAVFFLDSPRIIHCFGATISSPPTRAQAHPSGIARLRPLPGQKLVAGSRIQLRFQLEGDAPTNPVGEITLRAVLTPGVWHSRETVRPGPDGSVTWEFTPPEAGLYYFYAGLDGSERAAGNTPILTLQASEAALASIK